MFSLPTKRLLRNISEAILSEFRTISVTSGYAHRTSKMSELASEAFISNRGLLRSSNIPPLRSIPHLLLLQKPNPAVHPTRIRQYTTTESTEQPLPPDEEPDSNVVSDQEYNIRLGRAIYTLETTLPTFFETGLVSIALRGDESSISNEKQEFTSNSTWEKTIAPESIYASNIKLSYMPPAAFNLPAAFPRNLQVEGLPLYHASAAFIRHTLSAFNTDLQLNLCKLTVRSPGSRNRQIEIRVIISGRSRLSGASNEWDVCSTYTLSPHTGLIDVHVVDSIHPAPHITFLDGLRGTLARLAGLDLERRPATNGLHAQSKAS